MVSQCRNLPKALHGMAKYAGPDQTAPFVKGSAVCAQTCLVQYLDFSGYLVYRRRHISDFFLLRIAILDKLPYFFSYKKEFFPSNTIPEI